MTRITHHLTDALLMAYSAGSLPEAFSLTVATHVSLCDECRARLGAFDTVGGALLEAEAAPMSGDSLDATLARIRADGETRRTRPAPRRTGVLPAPLRDYVGGDLESVRWRPIGMGVKQAILPTQGGATARLLYIPAGAAVPDRRLAEAAASAGQGGFAFLSGIPGGIGGACRDIPVMELQICSAEPSFDHPPPGCS